MKYLLSLLLSSFLLFSCVKKECKFDSPYYVFEIPATFSPQKDTFRIGDTITITSTFSNSVYDKITNQNYTLDNFKFYPSTKIDRLDTLDSHFGLEDFFLIGNSDFDYHPFYASDGTNSLIGQYNYSNSTYTLSYKLVLLAKGQYLLNHVCTLFNLGDEQDFPGKCSNKNNEISVNLNQGSDNNIDMLMDSPDPHYNTWILEKPDERFYKWGGYAFYVTD